MYCRHCSVSSTSSYSAQAFILSPTHTLFHSWQSSIWLMQASIYFKHMPFPSSVESSHSSHTFSVYRQIFLCLTHYSCTLRQYSSSIWHTFFFLYSRHCFLGRPTHSASSLHMDWSQILDFFSKRIYSTCCIWTSNCSKSPIVLFIHVVVMFYNYFCSSKS